MTPEIDKHLTANGRLRKRTIMVSNFLGGLSWGFGTAIGATVVVAVLLAISKNFTFIPFVNDITNTYQQVKDNRIIQNEQRYYQNNP